MKQKKIGTTLYVFFEDPYVITEDTDANIIYIQEEVIFDFAKINIPLISKMQPINYHIVCVKHPEWADYYNDFTVYVEQTTGGTVTAYPTSSDENEEILLTHSAAVGYEFDSWDVRDEDDNEIEIVNNKFLMPASNVTVNATFNKLSYNITIDSNIQNGTLSVQDTAEWGETLFVENYPNYGYILDTLTVTCSGVPITVTNNKFEMPIGDVVVTCTFTTHDYLDDYVTIESLVDNNVVKWGCGYGRNSSRYISYSTDKINWNTVLSTTAGVTIGTLNTGDKLYLKAYLMGYTKYLDYSYISISKKSKVYGNIQSLRSFESTLDKANFRQLFFTNINLVDATNLILPVTTLAENCYERMFQGCSKLKSITMLATDISASSCLDNWVKGVAATGTFTKAASMTTLPTGDSGIPTGWAVVDA